MECNRTFRFGNDQTSRCRKACLIPVNFAGKTGHLYAYVLKGSTPFLFPQQYMIAFDLNLQRGKKRLSWGDQGWTEVKQRQPKGHFLLNLAEDMNHLRRNLRTPQFRKVPEEVDANILSTSITSSKTEDSDSEEDDIDDK